MTQQALLATQDLEKALSRQGVEHPLLDVFGTNSSALLSLNEVCREMPTLPAQQDYVKHNLGFLVDAIEKVDNFLLGPLDMVAVWSAMEHLHLPIRYKLTRSIAFAYITIPLPTRKNSSLYFLEQEVFPEGLFGSEDDVKKSTGRLTQISTSLKEIEFYRYGVRKTFSELLQGATSPEGLQLITQVTRRERNSPLIMRLKELDENYNNGIAPLQPYLNALKF